jgi:hypothetical protein
MDPTLGYNCHLTGSSDTARQKKNKRNDVEVKKYHWSVAIFIMTYR